LALRKASSYADDKDMQAHLKELEQEFVHWDEKRKKQALRKLMKDRLFEVKPPVLYLSPLTDKYQGQYIVHYSTVREVL
jgi:hypothetical protein